MLKKHNKRLMGWEDDQKTCPKMQLSMRGEEVKRGYPGGALIKACYKTVLSNGYYIDLMLSVDSHYLNDPLPKNCSSTGSRSEYWEGGCYVERTCNAFKYRFQNMARTAAIAERLWSNDTVTDLNSMRAKLLRSFQTRRSGITHIRNKEVILRKYQLSRYEGVK
jgi:hexosaminidase